MRHAVGGRFELLAESTYSSTAHSSGYVVSTRRTYGGPGNARREINDERWP
jgi:hypothetical protein